METSGFRKISAGEQLLGSLNSLLQLVRIYQGNNQLVVNSLRLLVDAAAHLIRDDSGLALQLENGRFFLNDEKLLRRPGALDHVLGTLFDYFDDRRLHGLQLLPGLLVASPGKLVEFATLLNECVHHPDSSVWLSRQLQESGIDWVEIHGKAAGESAGEELGDLPAKSEGLEAPGQRSPRKVYAYTLRSLKDVSQKIAVNQRVGIRKTVRMVQIMIDEIVLQEQQLLLAMSTIRAYDDYTFTHSVNVAILCLYIGRQLGLPKETMEYLGVCGLFHDLGKILVPSEVLNKEAPLTNEEFKKISRHSLDSTRLIVQLLAAPVARKARILLPPFEHHLNYDLSGYPILGWNRPISLCGRILAIADVYDALTSPRVYRREALSADRALGLMLQGAGTVFDPIILKIFIRMLGAYPIGTLLELDSGEIALVSRPPSTGDLNRPWVVVLDGDGGGGYRRGKEINLAEPDEAGEYRYRIARSVHPSTRGIQPAEFLT
jgi:HD-GYP domain-containing protein (c-di-GMP phosphodiesterase class II)